MLEQRRIDWLAILLRVLLIGICFGMTTVVSLRADDTAPVTSEKSPPEVNDNEGAGAKRITPDQFSDVDKLTTLTVFTLVVFILGVVALLALIVVGARRLRRMTRSPLLKSKYDELELLREKYRREVEGVDTPPPPSREQRR